MGSPIWCVCFQMRQCSNKQRLTMRMAEITNGNSVSMGAFSHFTIRSAQHFMACARRCEMNQINVFAAVDCTTHALNHQHHRITKSAHLAKRLVSSLNDKLLSTTFVLVNGCTTHVTQRFVSLPLPHAVSASGGDM